MISSTRWMARVGGPFALAAVLTAGLLPLGAAQPAAAARRAPTATISSSVTTTSAVAVTFTVKFSTKVSGLAATDFQLAGTAFNCTVGSPVASGSLFTYRVTVSGCGEGTVALRLLANSIRDAYGTLGPTTTATSPTVTIDRSAATATIRTPASPTALNNPQFAVTFSEPVTGVAAADFELTGTATGCGIGQVSTAGNVATVSVNSCSEGTVGLRLLAASTLDLAGNAGPAMSVASSLVVIDRTGPTVTITPPLTPTNADLVNFLVDFSEPVPALSSAAFTVSGTARACGIENPVQTSDRTWTVGVTGCTNGTVALNLVRNGASDLAGNAGPATLVASSLVTIDRNAPSATLTCTPGSGVTNLSSVGCTVAFSETPGSGTAFDAADVVLGGSATGWSVTGITELSPTSYTFTLATTGLDGQLTVAIRPGAIQDAATNATTASRTIVLGVDRTAPQPVIACTPASGAFTATSVTCEVTFSELPAGASAFDLADVTLAGNATGWSVTSVAGAGYGPYLVTFTGAGADGTLVIGVQAAATVDLAGNGSTASAPVTLISDRTAPVVAAPGGYLRGATVAASALPYRVTWSVNDGNGSGAVRHELSRSLDGGRTWAVVSGTLTAAQMPVSLPVTGTVRYRVRVIDGAGHVSAYSAYGPTLSPRLIQQNLSVVKYSSGWYGASSTAYLGGSAKYTKSRGKSVSYTFTGRSIGVVMTKGASRGAVQVFVNGVYYATVDTYRSSTLNRQLVWQHTFGSSATRTIKLVVLGTAGRPRVDLDGFVVVR